MRPTGAPFEMYLSDLLEQYPVFPFNLGVPLLSHLLILLFVDEHRLSRVVVRDRLHLRQLLSVPTQVLVSPLACKNLRRTGD